MRRLVTIGAAVPLLALLHSPVAAAAPTESVTCARVDPYTGECLITAAVPGGGGSQDEEGAVEPGVASTGTRSCYSTWTQSTVPCSTSDGYWSDDRQCRIAPVQPPPPRTDPVWAGQTEGAVYSCIPDVAAGGALVDYTFWAATPPPGAAAAPNPADVAQLAITAMGLEAVDIGIVPEPGPGNVGLVGLPVWMWVEDPVAQTIGPLTESASVGDVTVTATASVNRVEWSMGDGTTITCLGPGTPYLDAYGDRMSPDCGHRYSQPSTRRPGEAYPVTATSYWTVDWVGAAATGRIYLDFTAQAEVQVGELQVLVAG